MINVTAEIIANAMDVTYSDVMSFARAVVTEMRKDKVADIFTATQAPELLLAYLEPAIKSQERVRLFFQTNRSAAQALVMQVHANVTN